MIRLKELLFLKWLLVKADNRTESPAAPPCSAPAPSAARCRPWHRSGPP